MKKNRRIHFRIIESAEEYARTRAHINHILHINTQEDLKIYVLPSSSIIAIFVAIFVSFLVLVLALTRAQL